MLSHMSCEKFRFNTSSYDYMYMYLIKFPLKCLGFVFKIDNEYLYLFWYPSEDGFFTI